MQFDKIILRLVLGLAGIGACWSAWWIVYQDSQARIADKEKPDDETAIAVEVMPARWGTVEERLELVGSLTPRDQVEIRSRVSGYITDLPYDVGQAVQTRPAGFKGIVHEDGDDGAREPVEDDVEIRPVVSLDDRTEQEQIANAEAALRVAEAELLARQAELALARQSMTRQQGLRNTGAGTQQQFEQAESALKIAEAQVALGEARVSEAVSVVEQARLALEDLNIWSPIRGVVATRLVDVGDLAQPDTPLLRIVSLELLETLVHVVEKDYSKVKVGDVAEIRVDAYPDCTFTGTVTRIAPVVDPDTRTAAVQIEVYNPYELCEQTSETRLLKPGMHARVDIIYGTGERNVYVPVGAVVEDGRNASVFVVTGDPPTAEQRPVALGITNGQVVEILQGVQRDEHVVTLGQRLLTHGQAVQALPVPWPDALDPQLAGPVEEEAQDASSL